MAKDLETYMKDHGIDGDARDAETNDEEASESGSAASDNDDEVVDEGASDIG
jgi:hypothetical protein